MRLKCRVSPDVIFNFIKNTPYSNEAGAGFTKVELSHDGITATFNKKVIVFDPVLDPFGEMIEFERVVFEQVCFSIKVINGALCLLTLYNPPKSVRSFIDYLSGADGVSVAFGNVSLDINHFMHIIRNDFGFKVFGISKVKISNLPVAEKTKAMLELSSTGDALNDLKHFIGNEKFQLDKIKVVGVLNSLRSSFELSSVASAVIPNEFYTTFNEAVACIEGGKI